MSQLATIDELFSDPPKRRFKEVQLPVRGKTVRIQSLFEQELSAYQLATISTDGTAKLRKARLEDANRRLLCLCLVDAAGNRLLGDGDTGRFAGWDSADTQFLYEECAAWVGLKRGDVEDLVKNSETLAGVVGA